MKLIVLGHGRHGKDTVCEIISKNTPLTFMSSSWYLCEKVIFDKLKYKYNYDTVLECYNDRHFHREEWFQIISNYNSLENPSRLVSDILSEYDIYCGIRNFDEFEDARDKNLFDYSIWVDRSDHLPLEPSSSFNIPKSECNFILDNNGTLEKLESNTLDLITYLLNQSKDI